jgi:hypothetical protein
VSPRGSQETVAKKSHCWLYKVQVLLPVFTVLLSLSTNDPITPALFSEADKLLYPTSVATQVEQCLPEHPAANASGVKDLSQILSLRNFVALQVAFDGMQTQSLISLKIDDYLVKFMNVCRYLYLK